MVNFFAVPPNSPLLARCLAPSNSQEEEANAFRRLFERFIDFPRNEKQRCAQWGVLVDDENETAVHETASPSQRSSDEHTETEDDTAEDDDDEDDTADEGFGEGGVRFSHNSSINGGSPKLRSPDGMIHVMLI